MENGQRSDKGRLALFSGIILDLDIIQMIDPDYQAHVQALVEMFGLIGLLILAWIFRGRIFGCLVWFRIKTKKFRELHKSILHPTELDNHDRPRIITRYDLILAQAQTETQIRSDIQELREEIKGQISGLCDPASCKYRLDHDRKLETILNEFKHEMDDFEKTMISTHDRTNDSLSNTRDSVKDLSINLASLFRAVLDKVPNGRSAKNH